MMAIGQPRGEGTAPRHCLQVAVLPQLQCPDAHVTPPSTCVLVASLPPLQVYVEMRVVPVTPADVYTMRLGGLYDDQSREPPFVAGHEGVAVVAKVGGLQLNISPTG